MILSKIKQYLLREIKWISLLNHYKIVWFKKIFIFISSFFVISFLIWDITFAADATTTTAADAAATFAQRFWEILKWVSVLLWLMTYLATLFLSPEWINGSLFWMSTKFKEVWIMVSNIVYFVFAFILIWIAFMNIIGKNADQYQLKQALPKFIVWVIIVPFSWFFVQLILSISSLLTVSALTLPSNSFPEYESILWQITIPTECVINVKSIWKWSWEWEWKTTDLVDCSHSVKKPLSTVVSWWNINNSIFWIISMYTYGLTGFENSDNIFLSESSKFTSIADVAIKIIFDWLFIIIYAILMIALWMVLMIRWIYIWIYTMMSPIFWLMYFFDKKDWGDWFFAKFNIKEFIALAMVPVYTMLALSFGLLFMYVVWEWITWWARQWEISGQSVTVKTVDDWWTISIWLFTLKIVWAVSWSNDDNFWFLKKIWNEWLWVVWSLILKLFGIVVLWWTVMAAMRSSDITKAIVEPLHQFGTKVWGIMTSAPWNMPIFGGQSMSSMSTAAWTVSSAITTAQNQRGTKLWQKFSWWTQITKDYQDVKALTWNSVDSHLSNVKATIAKHSFDDLVDNSAWIDALTTHLSRLANSDWFKNKDMALKLIKDIREKWVWNANLVSENLAKLDADAISGNMSIMGWTENIVKAKVKDNFWKNADTTKSKASVEIKVSEAETWNAIKIDVWGSSYTIARDSDNRTTNDVDRKQLIKQIVSALNKWISIEEINDKILDNFSDSTDVIKNNWLYYNKDTKKYRSTEADWFEKVESIQTEN